MGAPAPSRFIVVGIDGTGSRSWMRPDGSNSHTFRFVRDFRYGTYGVDRMWYHGPSDTMYGRETEAIVEKALRFINNRLNQLFPNLKGRHQPLQTFDVNTCERANYYSSQMPDSPYGHQYQSTTTLRRQRQVTPQMLQRQPLSTNDVKVILVGHSRGGLAATVLARMLSPIVKVYFLGLYDAVDRQPCLNGMLVENVQVVYHGRRHPEMGSRSYFANTSVQYKPGIIVREKFFHTTHGGIGGDFLQDARKAGMGDDTTCIPYGRQVVNVRGGPIVIDRTHPIARRQKKPINIICEDGKQAANRFIREGAKLYGLPIG